MMSAYDFVLTGQGERMMNGDRQMKAAGIATIDHTDSLAGTASSRAGSVAGRRSTILKWAVLLAAAATLVAGCGNKDDPIAKAEKKDVAKGVPAPSIE